MPWQLSRDAQSTAPQRSYDGGGVWGQDGCATEWTPQARALADRIRQRFAWVRTIGGVRCEQLGSTGQLSIHAAGRALDVMVPHLGGEEGEELANWLVENARALGVQLVIWNGAVWQGTLNEPRQRAYSGANPHVDHVHVEVLLAGGTGGVLTAPGGSDSGWSTAQAIGAGVGGALTVAGAVGAAVWLKKRRKKRRR